MFYTILFAVMISRQVQSQYQQGYQERRIPVQPDNIRHNDYYSSGGKTPQEIPVLVTPEEIPRHGLKDDKCPNGTLDIAFLIDASGSIGPRNFMTIKKFSQKLVSTLNIDCKKINLAVLQFSRTATIKFNFDKCESVDINFEIGNLTYTKATTNIYRALKVAREDIFNGLHGDREKVRNAVLLVTDGVSNVQKNSVESEAARLRENATIVGLRVGIHRNSEEINSIVTNGQLISSKYKNLLKNTQKVANKLLELIC